MTKKLLEIKNLQKSFAAQEGGRIRAVDNISLYVNKNETLGLVGESGCGKSTTGKMILKLTSPEAGEIVYEDSDIVPLTQKEFKPYRKKIQMIFQDLDAALNPNMRIKNILAEAVKIRHPDYAPEKIKHKVTELLSLVHLPAGKAEQFPNLLSGGEKRRVGIARTLALEPEFIVADEPTSALDVSVQAQVVNLMQDLQKDFGLSYLFISHDLHLVELLSHRIAVMYLGQIVEQGPAKEVAQRPQHPYTRSLWASLAIEDKSDNRSPRMPDAFVEDAERPTVGCRFAPRCPVYQEKQAPDCTQKEPTLSDMGNDHVVACHFPLK